MMRFILILGSFCSKYLGGQLHQPFARDLEGEDLVLQEDKGIKFI